VGIFATSGMSSSYQYQVSLIEEDYVYYQDMISYAKQHEDDGYIVDAIVAGKYYNTTAEKYYIEYKIALDNGSYLYGETYSCYTLQEASKYRINSTIEVAVDSVPITLLTDSVNVDYENMSLEKDGEYVAANKGYKTTNTIKWVLIVSFIALIAFSVYYAYKKKELADEKENKEKAKEEPAKGSYCKYCGSSIDPNDRKCPNCGAGLR
jgi:rubrerythrin